jgi:hypothetical protein
MQYFPKIALCILTVLLSGVVVYLLTLLYDETGQQGKAKAITRYLLQKEVKVQSKAIYLQQNKTRGAYSSVASTSKFLLQFW